MNSWAGQWGLAWAWEITLNVTWKTASLPSSWRLALSFLTPTSDVINTLNGV